MKLIESFKNRKVSTSAIVILRIIIGGYVAYTAVDLFLGRGQSDIPIEALIPACIVLFIVGGVVAGISLYDLFTGRYKGGVADPDNEE